MILVPLKCLDALIFSTLASNDAPTASLSVMYDEHTDERQGAYFNYKKYP